MSRKEYKPRLFELYKDEIIPNLSKDLNLSNVMQVPKLVKINLNMGLGDAKENKNSLNQAINELSMISGQKAVITYSKKAISNFKIRKGDPVGVSVTLRNIMMYEFLDRFISISSPRIRDFRGLNSNGFDGRGNYNFGITEQIIFPEIDYDKVNEIRGLNVSIVTSSIDDNGAHKLLKLFGFPINDMKKTKDNNVKASTDIEDISEVKLSTEAEETQEAEEVPETEAVPDKEEDSVTEETPEAKAAPDTDDAPVAEETQEAEEVPETEAVPDKEEDSVTEETPEAEEVPETEAVPDKEEDSVTEETPEAKAAPETKTQESSEVDDVLDDNSKPNNEEKDK